MLYSSVFLKLPTKQISLQSEKAIYVIRTKTASCGQRPPGGEGTVRGHSRPSLGPWEAALSLLLRPPDGQVQAVFQEAAAENHTGLPVNSRPEPAPAQHGPADGDVTRGPDGCKGVSEMLPTASWGQHSGTAQPATAAPAGALSQGTGLPSCPDPGTQLGHPPGGAPRGQAAPAPFGKRLTWGPQGLRSMQIQPRHRPGHTPSAHSQRPSAAPPTWRGDPQAGCTWCAGRGFCVPPSCQTSISEKGFVGGHGLLQDPRSDELMGSDTLARPSAGLGWGCCSPHRDP